MKSKLALPLLIILCAPCAFANDTPENSIDNYQDGVVLNHSSKLGRGIIISTTTPNNEKLQFTNSIEYRDLKGNELLALLGVNKALPNAGEVDEFIQELILNRQQISGIESGLYAKYTVTQLEAESVLGANSFIYREMRRCNLDSILVEVGMNSSETKVKFNNSPTSLASDSLYAVSFCV